MRETVRRAVRRMGRKLRVVSSARLGATMFRNIRVYSCLRFLTLVSVGCLSAGISAQAAAIYSVTSLGPVVNVAAINNQGEVLANDTNLQPFLFSNGQRQYLPQPPGGNFSAGALNDLGQVAGYVNFTGTYSYDLALFSNSSLQVMTNVSGVFPTALNNAGQIAGNQVFAQQAFLYANGMVSTIRALPPYGVATVRGMNAAGAVVGFFSGGGNGRQGFVFANGQVTPVAAPGSVSSEATAISGTGEVVGDYAASTSSSLNRLFLSRNGTAQDLGTAFQATSEVDIATGVNDAGLIVGGSELSVAPGYAAWLYTPGFGFSNLNSEIDPSAGWSLQGAEGINNNGQIVGIGSFDGQQEGFLLTPVPEVSAEVMVLGGLVVLLSAAWARRGVAAS